MPDIVLRIDYCDVKVIAKKQKLDNRENYRIYGTFTQ